MLGYFESVNSYTLDGPKFRPILYLIGNCAEYLLVNMNRTAKCFYGYRFVDTILGRLLSPYNLW